MANNAYIIVSIYETIAYFVFLIFAVGSVIYASCRMRGTLFSGEVKSLILKRHIAYIVSYCVFNLFLLFVATVNIISYMQEGSKDQEWIANECNKPYARILLWLFCAQGFLHPLVRIFEPSFLTIVGKNLRKLCRCVEKKEEPIKRPSLQSALNTTY